MIFNPWYDHQSNVNTVTTQARLEKGAKAIFFVMSDSKIVDASGKQINYIQAKWSKGKKVEIEYYTITDATGSDPSRNDFAFEIDQKGVRLMRFIDRKAINQGQILIRHKETHKLAS